jgi:HD-like signal output (HDOD) protein
MLGVTNCLSDNKESDMAVHLDELLAKSSQLPAIPKIMQELLNSIDNSDVELVSVGKKIAMDPSLGASVLKMANSAAFRGQHEIRSIEEAVIRLGIKRIRSLVVAAGLHRILPKGLNPQVFWFDAFRVANLAKLMAQYANSEPETAFTCAMLHNLGELMIAFVLPEEAGLVDLLVEEGETRIEAQRHQLGYDYAQIGAALAKRWQFSPLIVEAIKQQLRPDTVNPSVEAALIRMALFSLRSLDAGVSAESICEHLPPPLVATTQLDAMAIAPLLADAAAEGELLAKAMLSP